GAGWMIVTVGGLFTGGLVIVGFVGGGVGVGGGAAELSWETKALKTRSPPPAVCSQARAVPGPARRCWKGAGGAAGEGGRGAGGGGRGREGWLPGGMPRLHAVPGRGRAVGDEVEPEVASARQFERHGRTGAIVAAKERHTPGLVERGLDVAPLTGQEPTDPPR